MAIVKVIALVALMLLLFNKLFGLEKTWKSSLLNAVTWAVCYFAAYSIVTFFSIQ